MKTTLQKKYEEGIRLGRAEGFAEYQAKILYFLKMNPALRKAQIEMASEEVTNQLLNLKIEPLKCGFSKAWVGKCDCTDILENGQCEEHQDKCKCGELATNSCAHAGQSVCGRPLCDNCQCGH